MRQSGKAEDEKPELGRESGDVVGRFGGFGLGSGSVGIDIMMIQTKLEQEFMSIRRDETAILIVIKSFRDCWYEEWSPPPVDRSWLVEHLGVLQFLINSLISYLRLRTLRIPVRLPQKCLPTSLLPTQSEPVQDIIIETDKTDNNTRMSKLSIRSAIDNFYCF